MNTFAFHPAQHPRATDGTFATTPRTEADITLARQVRPSGPAGDLNFDDDLRIARLVMADGPKTDAEYALAQRVITMAAHAEVAVTLHPGPAGAAVGNAPTISAQDLEWAESMTGNIDADSSLDYYPTMDRVFAAARRSVADQDTLAVVAQLVATATSPAATPQQARAHLERIRSELAAAGHLPAEPTDPQLEARRIDAPFAGTELDHSPELAVSHLQLLGDGDRYALILKFRMMSTIDRTMAHPTVVLDEYSDPHVWLAGRRVVPYDDEIAWGRIAAGQHLPVPEVQSRVAERIREAEEARRRNTGTHRGPAGR
jgi:hypothetical protein